MAVLRILRSASLSFVQNKNPNFSLIRYTASISGHLKGQATQDFLFAFSLIGTERSEFMITNNIKHNVNKKEIPVRLEDNKKGCLVRKILQNMYADLKRNSF